MYIVIFITCPHKKEANKIAQKLVEKKLAACVNIVEKVESFFWWQGKVERANEALLIIKSKKEKLAKIIKAVKLMHSYAVPEVIALPISGGNKSYLRWVNESCKSISNRIKGGVL